MPEPLEPHVSREGVRRCQSRQVAALKRPVRGQSDFSANVVGGSGVFSTRVSDPDRQSGPGRDRVPSRNTWQFPCCEKEEASGKGMEAVGVPRWDSKLELESNPFHGKGLFPEPWKPQTMRETQRGGQRYRLYLECGRKEPGSGPECVVRVQESGFRMLWLNATISHMPDSHMLANRSGEAGLSPYCQPAKLVKNCREWSE